MSGLGSLGLISFNEELALASSISDLLLLQRRGQDTKSCPTELKHADLEDLRP